MKNKKKKIKKQKLEKGIAEQQESKKVKRTRLRSNG